jgi:hypothetical protein
MGRKLLKKKGRRYILRERERETARDNRETDRQREIIERQIDSEKDRNILSKRETERLEEVKLRETAKER